MYALLDRVTKLEHTQRYRRTFARPNAFTPRVIKTRFLGRTTLLEPSATATATAGFAGLEDAAFGTLAGCLVCYYRF